MKVMVYALATVVLTTTATWAVLVMFTPTMNTDDALGVIGLANVLGVVLLRYMMLKRRHGRSRWTSEHARQP
jgi:uncharacterized membrane protein